VLPQYPGLRVTINVEEVGRGAPAAANLWSAKAIALFYDFRALMRSETSR
jgi:hypothetical protein